MVELSDIQPIIDARTSENNHLAIELMMTQLGLSFQEAFKYLKLTDCGSNIYKLEITHITIQYKVVLHEMEYVPAAFADIYRRIYYKDKLEPASDIHLLANEESVFNLGYYGNPINLPELKADLQGIAPHIEALYELMQQGY